MKIGPHRYTVRHDPPKKRLYGRVLYGVKTISVYRSGDDARDRNTLWHETVHAILYEMGSPMHKREDFVREFADLLSGAIDSAKF